MIDSSLPEDRWNELEDELSSEVGASAEAGGAWNEEDSWIDEDTWIDEEAWGDENLSESLTIKYLGPQAVRAA